MLGSAERKLKFCLPSVEALELVIKEQEFCYPQSLEKVVFPKVHFCFGFSFGFGFFFLSSPFIGLLGLTLIGVGNGMVCSCFRSESLLLGLGLDSYSLMTFGAVQVVSLPEQKIGLRSHFLEQ